MRTPTGRRRTANHRRWLAALAFLAVLLAGSLAFARAGGGGHYASGSYGGTGGSSGDGVSSFILAELLEGLIELTVAHPLAMLPIWAFLIGCFVVLRSFVTQSRRETLEEVSDLEAERLRPSRPEAHAFAELEQADSAFDREAFFNRTEKIFLEVQQAWSRGELTSVRQYMSDGVYRRFTALLALMQLEGERNLLADTQVRDLRLQELTRTAAYDCLTVVIDAAMRDLDVRASLSEAEAQRRLQAAQVAPFTELWTFMRRRGAKTKPGLGEGRCPNCGAPFTGGATNTCEYCKTVVNSGNHDWVLTEITQPEAYLPRHREVPGLPELQARDPDAAPELLQDRGLLLFWKWLQARAEGDARVARKVFTVEAGSALDEQIREAEQRGRRFKVHDPAVGGTSVAAIEQVGEFFRAHVEIRWSATFDGLARASRSILTMVRAADAKTDPGKGLSTERCGNCGAPLTDSDGASCEFCGHDLTSPARCWQFETLEPYERWRRPGTYTPRPRGGSAFATRGERVRLLGVMVSVIKADGVVKRGELSLLKECARRWDVPWELVQTLLESELDAPFDELPRGQPEAARAFLGQLVELAQIDGRIDRKERELISRAGAKLGLPAESVEELLQRAG